MNRIPVYEMFAAAALIVVAAIAVFGQRIERSQIPPRGSSEWDSIPRTYSAQIPTAKPRVSPGWTTPVTKAQVRDLAPHMTVERLRIRTVDQAARLDRLERRIAELIERIDRLHIASRNVPISAHSN